MCQPQLKLSSQWSKSRGNGKRKEREDRVREGATMRSTEGRMERGGEEIEPRKKKHKGREVMDGVVTM